MEQIDDPDFKTTRLRFLERMDQTGEPIKIFENGEPSAIVHALSSRSRNRAFGALKSTLRGPLGDLVEPITGNEWEARQK